MIERRKYARKSLPIKVSLQDEYLSGKEPALCQVVDASPGGLSFEYNRSLPIGEAMVLRVDTGDRVFDLDAEVRHSYQSGSNQFVVGVVLLNLTSEEFEAVSRAYEGIKGDGYL